MTNTGRTLMVLLVWILCVPAATAHEVRPAYLDLREAAADTFAVLWKVPAVGQMRLALDLRLPPNCKAAGEPTTTFDGGAYVERRTIICDGGLGGQTIGISGLEATMTDVLARITHADGSTEIARVKADAPAFTVAGRQSSLDVARTYFLLGVEHILGGFDHLIFVLALVVLLRGARRIVETVTAFTVAHSITLIASALGFFSLPQKPVEATIALSIVFVAAEIVKADPRRPRFSERYPWVIAFSFGLLHGFGFAGALQEIGLPHTDIPMAMLTFNLGVEAGQLLFVAATLALLPVGRAISGGVFSAGRTAVGYAIGCTATFWLFDRLIAFGG